jgi:hypothetical protein
MGSPTLEMRLARIRARMAKGNIDDANDMLEDLMSDIADGTITVHKGNAPDLKEVIEEVKEETKVTSEENESDDEEDINKLGGENDESKEGESKDEPKEDEKPEHPHKFFRAKTKKA